jgi:hypothetical protein
LGTAEPGLDGRQLRGPGFCRRRLEGFRDLCFDWSTTYDYAYKHINTNQGPFKYTDQDSGSFSNISAFFDVDTGSDCYSTAHQYHDTSSFCNHSTHQYNDQDAVADVNEFPIVNSDIYSNDYSDQDTGTDSNLYINLYANPDESSIIYEHPSCQTTYRYKWYCYKCPDEIAISNKYTDIFSYTYTDTGSNLYADINCYGDIHTASYRNPDYTSYAYQFSYPANNYTDEDQAGYLNQNVLAGTNEDISSHSDANKNRDRDINLNAIDHANGNVASDQYADHNFYTFSDPDPSADIYPDTGICCCEGIFYKYQTGR